MNSSRFPSLRCLALFFAVFIPTFTSVHAEGKDPVVQLEVPDAPAIISALQQQQFARQAIQLVESSVFTPASAQAETNYRQALEGTFLLVTLPATQQLPTSRGPVMAREILLVLNNKEAVTALFTVDSAGNIATHSKYSGKIGAQITQGIRNTVPR